MVLFLCNLSVLMAVPLEGRLTALMYNDSVTLGLYDNPDDLRSYGMEFSFLDKHGWEISSSIFGMTLRDRQEYVGGRYDEFIVQGGRLFNFSIGTGEPEMLVELMPFGGIVAYGNLGLDSVQNFVHKFLDIQLVDLLYEADRAEVVPHFGSRGKFLYKEPASWFSITDLVFQAEVEFSHALSYVSKVTTGISVGQQTSSVSDLMIGLGYSWAHVYDEWFSHRIITMSETGLIAFLRGHFGVLSFTYQWFLDRLQGYGGVGVNIGFGDNFAWERNDVVLSMGMVSPGGISTTSLRYVVFDNLSVSISNMFKMVPLSEDERTRQIVSRWLLGVDYEFSLFDDGWMRPFVSLGGGINRILVMEDDTDSVIDSNGRVRAFMALRFAGDAQVGVRVFPEGELQYRGVAYGLEVAAGLMYNNTSDLDRFEGYELVLLEVWRPYVRVGVTAGSIL